jgi:hypothetical protein
MLSYDGKNYVIGRGKYVPVLKIVDLLVNAIENNLTLQEAANKDITLKDWYQTYTKNKVAREKEQKRRELLRKKELEKRAKEKVERDEAIAKLTQEELIALGLVKNTKKGTRKVFLEDDEEYI